MKQFLKYFLFYIVIFWLALYFLTIKEGMANYGITNYFQGIPKSFEYYFIWVLPYWWLVLIFASALSGVITLLIVKLKRKIKV